MGGKSMGKSKIVHENILDRWSITPDELTIAIDENPSCAVCFWAMWPSTNYAACGLRVGQA